MEVREIVFGVCCEYCQMFEKEDCPIKNASPWSKWDYCNHFRCRQTLKSIPEILMEGRKS